MTDRVRVVLWYRVPAGQRADIAAVYREISEEIVGTPGLLSSELLSSCDDDTVLMVTSIWESQEALTAWVQSSRHRSTSPLRPYLDREREHPYETFEVVAAI